MSDHPALRRIVEDEDARIALEQMSTLAGSDLTTLQLAAARERAARLQPVDVMRQYGRDRFVAPGQVDPVVMAELGLSALRSARDFEPVIAAPLAPFGVHAAVAGVDQNNVVTTTRGSEVAADPTVSLALEAAARRRASPQATVRLSAVERITRAQVFDGPRSFAHFSIFALVTAGRDRGGRDFEVETMAEQISTFAAFVDAAVALPIDVRLTDSDGRHHETLERIAARVEGRLASCEPWPERTTGRAYYSGICFKLDVRHGAERVEVGDGGIVDWTKALLQNRKERLMTGGMGLDRLAQLIG